MESSMHLYSFIRPESFETIRLSFSLDNCVSKISPDNMSDKSPVIPQYQFSQLYHLFVAGAVLGNEVVDVADVELVSLSRAVVLNLLPSTVELLLL
jgi:hypothetical protein